MSVFDQPQPAPQNPPDMAAELHEPGFTEKFSGGWQAETVRTDAWGYKKRKTYELADEVYQQLPEDYRARVDDWSRKNAGNPDGRSNLIADLARQASVNDPKGWGDTPAGIDGFSAEVDRRRLDAIDEAEAHLGAGGGGLAGFLGTMARGMTDETSLALMPLGGGAGSIAKFIATEAVLGGIGEAAVLPKEHQVASDLGLAPPQDAKRVAMGVAGGAVFSSGLVAIQRGWRYAKARRAPHVEGRTGDVSEAEHDAEVRAAEQAIAEGRDPTRAAQQGAGGQPAVFAGVVEAGPGYTIVRRSDGSTVRRDGTRAWRNNNPGNIEYGRFARANGAVGTDGRFAVFPTYEAGRAAKEALLFESSSYRGLSLGQAISRYAPSFENNTGSYIAQVARAAGVTPDTMLSTLSARQRRAMLDAMERVEGFRPGRENGVQAAARRTTSESDAPAGDASAFTGYTARGYTGTGQVSAGDFRIDVEYEVVDASFLSRASGDLQPRNRARAQSDEQIAEIAARLDPARLLPAPEADRGAPVVGPDGVIESGNGRVAAIERAAARHPDRFNAYRTAIEAAGYQIPEGVKTPVLIARRKSDLTPAERRRFVVSANDNATARMSATERAMARADDLGDDVLALYDPAQPLASRANRAFVSRALKAFPQTERNALADAGGTLNAEGVRTLKELMFARAYGASDILARYAETDAGPLRSLMEALDSAAPAWAGLRAEIAAGAVRPEFDITDYVLDAMRLIASARELAAREGGKVAELIDELLADADMFEGAVAPLTRALTRLMWRDGRAARAEDIAGFLTRYAAEARKVGRADAALFDAPTPADVLRAIDPEHFRDLEELGQPHAAFRPAEAPQDVPQPEFRDGASSPEAEAADEIAVTDIEEFGDIAFEAPDGTTTTMREMLDDLDADHDLVDVIASCNPGRAA